MAEENQTKSHAYDTTGTNTEVESKDRGLFDFLGNKKQEEKPQEEAIVTDFDNKVKVSDAPETKLEEQEPEKKHTLGEKLHRSTSSSSSSSGEEEEGEGGKKKKKEKKGLKEKIKEKIGGGDHEEGNKQKESAVPVEKVEADPKHPDTEENKGLLDKIKEKVPGQQKKPEELSQTSSEYDAAHTESHEGEAKDKEKKGLLDKIKEKIPGYHPKSNEDKEKESGTH